MTAPGVFGEPHLDVLLPQLQMGPLNKIHPVLVVTLQRRQKCQDLRHLLAHSLQSHGFILDAVDKNAQHRIQGIQGTG